MSNAVRIKRLGKKDVLLFENLNKLFYEVFEMGNYTPVKKAYLEKLLNNTHFIVFVAICNGEVIGGFTAFELPMYYAEYSEVLIYDMAVHSKFQRKGVNIFKCFKESVCCNICCIVKISGPSEYIPKNWFVVYCKKFRKLRWVILYSIQKFTFGHYA